MGQKLRSCDFLYSFIYLYFYYLGCPGSLLLGGLLYSCSEQGLLSGCAPQASLLAASRLKSTGWTVVARKLLVAPIAGGTFPYQGSNPCFLHCQADSLPLSYYGSLDLFDFHAVEILTSWTQVPKYRKWIECNL